MKTIKRITALLIAMLAISLSAALLTACGGSHTCEFETAWTFDDENHWHKCKDADCAEISGKAAHDWDDGVETTAATVFAKGVKTFTCKDCGKTKTEETATVTSSDAAFSALKDSSQKMTLNNGYIIMTDREVVRDSDNDGKEDSSDYAISVTWNSEGKGAYKEIYDGSTSYDVVDVKDNQYYKVEIEKGETSSVINKKEYVSNDYWNKLYASEAKETIEDFVLSSESECKETLSYSIKSYAYRYGFKFKSNNEGIAIDDIKDSDMSYVCNVSAENGTAKIVVTISFKTDWLATIYVDNDGDSCDIKEFSMKLCYEFTADKLSNYYQEFTVKAVDGSQKELGEYTYTGFEFETEFKSALFDEAKKIETDCPAYEGTVAYHTVNIYVYINGERDSGYGPVAYNDKTAAKTVIDGVVGYIQSGNFYGISELNVEAYLDKDFTVEYTEANKNDLVIDCAEGGNIYLKVTPVDDTKTLVNYVYAEIYGTHESTSSHYELVDRTSNYEIVTNRYGTNYTDEISVDGKVITGTTYDLTGKDFVVIRCTKATN